VDQTINAVQARQQFGRILEEVFYRRHNVVIERAGRPMAALLTAGTTPVEAIPEDPTDEKFLACALEGEADYVVTGDEHLLRLGVWHGITIITPAAFVQAELAATVAPAGSDAPEGR